MMDEITITIPKYAARYLERMCQQERDRINYGIYKEQCGITLQDQASFDSINQIESALPKLD